MAYGVFDFGLIWVPVDAAHMRTDPDADRLLFASC